MPVLPDTFVQQRPGQNARDFLGAYEGMSSLMERKQRLNMAEEQHNLEQAQAVILAPLQAEKVKSDLVKARTDYQIAMQTEAARAAAYKLYDTAATDFNYVNQITDAQERANASREWLSRYSQLSNIKELNPQIESMNSLATKNIEGALKVNMLGTASERSFASLTEGMAPEQVDAARRIKLGLEGRASSAGKKSLKVKLPNGADAEMVFDPNSGEYSIPQIAGGAKTPDEGNSMVGMGVREEAAAKAQGTKESEYQATLKAARPKREAALKQATAMSDQLTDDIDSLIDRVSVATAGPGGVILDKFPGSTARDLQANLDSLKANIGFQALQAMREASPTGGALGNVSDTENRLLQARFGSLEIGQSPKQLIENLKKVRQRIVKNLGITQAAFDSEYGAGGEDAAQTPVVIKSIKRID